MADADLGIKVGVIGATETTQKLDQVKKSTDGVTQSVKQLQTTQQQQTATGQAWTGLINNISFSYDQNSKKANDLSDAHERLGASTRAFRDVMHTINPVLASAGGNLGALGGLVGAARAGIAGLAIAFGGILVASINTANEALESTHKQL